MIKSLSLWFETISEAITKYPRKTIAFGCIIALALALRALQQEYNK